MRDWLKTSGFLILFIGVLGVFTLSGVLAGLYAGTEIGKTVSYCDELPKSQTFNYTGEITDYNDSNITNTLFLDSESFNGGVMYVDLNNTRVENDSHEYFSYKERISVNCKAGGIEIEKHILNETYLEERPANGEPY